MVWAVRKIALIRSAFSGASSRRKRASSMPSRSSRLSAIKVWRAASRFIRCRASWSVVEVGRHLIQLENIAGRSAVVHQVQGFPEPHGLVLGQEQLLKPGGIHVTDCGQVDLELRAVS